MSIFLYLLPFSSFSRILSLALSYFICNLDPYLYNPLLPSFFLFCGIYSSCFSSLFLSFPILYLFLIPLLFFVHSYSHNLSLSVMFCILNLSFFLRYLLVFFFSYSCPSFLLSASFCSGAGTEPACRPVLPGNTQSAAAAKCLRAAGTAYFALLIIVPRNSARKGSLEDLQLHGRKM